MVNNKDSTSRPNVSRRKLLTVAVTAPIVPAPVSSFDPIPGARDPIVSLWRNWQRVHARASGLCRRWQEIEKHLIATVGFPQVRICSTNGDRTICAQTHAEIDQLIAKGNYLPDLGAGLHAEFAERHARWEAEAERVGFDEIKRQQDDAWDAEAAAVQAIFQTRAATLAGVEIKIALMVHLCFTGSDDPDFPLRQLRSTLADVKRLGRALEALQC